MLINSSLRVSFDGSMIVGVAFPAPAVSYVGVIGLLPMGTELPSISFASVTAQK